MLSALSGTRQRCTKRPTGTPGAAADPADETLRRSKPRRDPGKDWRVPDLYALSAPTADPRRSMSRASARSIAVISVKVNDRQITATLAEIGDQT